MIERCEHPTASRSFVVLGVFILALGFGLRPHPTRAACSTAFGCIGDCNRSGSVTVDKILTTVNIALGMADVSQCIPGDSNCDSTISVDEILGAVNNALNGCPLAVCGNAKLDAREDCDVGGTCIGGTNAGTPCAAESDCQGAGVCVGGPNPQLACASDAVCNPQQGGRCVHCVTSGNSVISAGGTCAANCTTETIVEVTLGVGSGAVINTGQFVAPQVPLQFSGTQTLKIGRMDPATGAVPVVIPAQSVQIPAIPLDLSGSQLCACVRGVAQKTCGGTLFQPDGTPAKDCTPGFSAGDSVCTNAGLPPCTFVNGSGNAASGVIGCGGLPGVNLTFTQDSNGAADPPQCDPFDLQQFNPPKPEYPTCGQPPHVAFDSAVLGGAGSAKILDTLSIGLIPAACTGSNPTFYGQDGKFCTDDDLPSPLVRGFPQTLPFVTGTATGQMSNVNQQNGRSICECTVSGEIPCVTEHCSDPFSTQGGAVSCDNLIANQDASGLTLVTAFGALSQPGEPLPLDDIVTTVRQVLQKP